MKDTLYNKFSSLFHSPLSTMSAAALLVTASVRLSFAIITACALLWQYLICIFITNIAKSVFPKKNGAFTSVLLAAFIGSVFYLILYFINPLLAIETGLFTGIVPILFAASGFSAAAQTATLQMALLHAFREALSTGLLIIALSCVREPLGFATLTLPGGDMGIFELFNNTALYPFPVRIIASSCGALLLLGYALLIFRHIEGRGDRG
ncbi:hypothetical protein FACS1894190_05430 [Spirochaetia bacterium]|nr:hypothetical protein FACS1894190_05430 [Spirochaetia bacterium]